MRYKIISEQPFRSIITEEWKRAVKILDPLLKNQRKPSFLWDYNMGRRTGGLRGVFGRCYPDRNAPMWKLGGRWRTAPIITISKRGIDKDGENGFREILRHEIIHLVEIRHNDRFKQMCKELGCDRFYRYGNALG